MAEDYGPLIVTARCCKDWPVLAMVKIGKCGLCGKVPVILPPMYQQEKEDTNG